jgi:transposase
MDATAPTDSRRIKGEEIARRFTIKPVRNGWMVPSQTRTVRYFVMLRHDHMTCTCPDFEMRHEKCKHIWAVEITLSKQIKDGKTTITKTVKMTYSQDWVNYDKAKTQEKGMFLKLLHDLCADIPNPIYIFGRPKLPLSDMVFSSALKVYSTFSLRRFMTDMQTAKDKGLIDKVPHYSTVALYMENEDLTPLLMNLIVKSSLPLKAVETNFAIDSSGFSTSRFDRWFSTKYGRYRDYKAWIKTHLVCGVKTNIITSVKITDSHNADSPQFQELVSKTAENFELKEISADKAYSSKDNLKFIDELGADAYIPFKSNTVAKARQPKFWKKLYHFFMFQREEFMEHYHQRSNAETVFHMIKSKFGDSVRSKTQTAQINEVLLKVLCHNICVVIQEIHELGIEPIFAVEKVDDN